MGALTQAAAYATDINLAAGLTAAVVRTAVTVAAEDDATPGHAARVALATKVLADPQGWTTAFGWATSTNAAVVDKWVVQEDFEGVFTDLPGVLGSIWDAVAGVG